MAKRRRNVVIYQPVVWVVGASRGIGREIAREFAAIGCDVCLSGRNKRQLDATVQEITRLGGKAFSYPCDLTKERSIHHAARSIVKQLGRIDVLVNNGGITVFKSFATTSMAEFNGIIDTNLRGPIACMKAVLPGMMKRKKGWIINILSTAAVKIFTGSSAYSSSKAAMHGLTNVLREELRPYNIKVVNILPGATETEMWSPSSRRNHGAKMMRAKSVAEAVLAVYQMPPDIVVEDILMRPIGGDIG